jgi:hypothetical protein
MTFPKTLKTKVAINKLKFPLVTYMVLSDARFDSYGLLMTEYGADFSGQNGYVSGFLRFKGIRCMKHGEGCLWILKVTCSAFQHLLIHMFSVSTTMVTTI